MKRAVSLVASLAALTMALTPVAVSAKDKKSDNRIPKVEKATSFPQAERDYDAAFSGRPAVQRVRVPGGMFISKPSNDLAPQSLLAKRVEIDIRTDVPTLQDLQTLLAIQGIQITIDYNSLYEASQQDSQVGSFTAASKYQEVANSVKGGTGVQTNNGFGGGFGQNGFNQNQGLNQGGGATPNVTVEGAASQANGDGGATPIQNRDVQGGNEVQSPAFLNRILPFRYFEGTVGELMRRLENTGNIAVWYQNGIVVGGSRQYAVAVLQQQDIVQSVVNELIRLGATNVVGSVGAGQVFYSSPPRTNNEIIEPYLKRMSGNMSEVTLQVALVTVSMTKSAEAGFDWSALNFGIGSNVTTGGSSGSGGGVGTPGLPGTPNVPGGSGGGTTGGTDGQLGNGVFTFSPNAVNANLGDIFGINRIVSVAGAINFLSRIGDTSVQQNVELRTLSGSPVILRSGEDIPYVSGVGSNFAGGFGGGVAQNAQTQRLGTGLTLNVDPRYDHTSGIVTMDIGLKLVDLVEFVQLNAGNQLGTLTQPRTREQGVNSILRIPAGQTTILGGIRREFTAENRNAPFGLFGIGNRKRQHEVFWLFAIVRPVVTVFETADSPVAPRSVLDTRTTVNPYDEGSYGVNGQPGDAVPVYGNGEALGGTPTYYGQGGYTPANRQPAGVTTSAPPAPRGIVVPGAATAPEVNANIPQGAVLRDPGANGAGYSVTTATTPTPAGVGAAPYAPAPVYPVAAPGSDPLVGQNNGNADQGSGVIPYAGEMANGAAVPVVNGQALAPSVPATVEVAPVQSAPVHQVVPVAVVPAEPAPRRSFIRPLSTDEKAN